MKKSEINKLDKLAKQVASDNFSGECIVCGKDGANLHHIEGRKIKSCRWYIPNLIFLCPVHHVFGLFSAHQSPLRFHQFLLDIYGQKYLNDIYKQSNKSFKGTFKDVEDYLIGDKNNYC